MVINTNYNHDLSRHALSLFLDQLPDKEKSYYNEIRQMSLRLYSLANRKKYFLDKTPRYYLILDDLIKVFPKSKIILLIRNPISVLSSIINTWIKEDWFRLKEFKTDLIDAIEVNLKHLHTKNVLKISYEKLISNPNNELAKLVTFIGPDIKGFNTKAKFRSSEKWFFGDQKIYSKQGIDKNNDINWIESLKSPQFWRVMHDYLTFIGEENYKKLGYSYSEMKEILFNHLPLNTLSEINNSTYSLQNLLDSEYETKNKISLLEDSVTNYKEELNKMEQLNKESAILLKKTEKVLSNKIAKLEKKLLRIINGYQKIHGANILQKYYATKELLKVINNTKFPNNPI